MTARALDEPRAGRLSTVHHVEPVADAKVVVDGKEYRISLAFYEVKKEKRFTLRSDVQTDAFAATIKD